MSDRRTGVVWNESRYTVEAWSDVIMYQIYDAQGEPQFPEYGIKLTPGTSGFAEGYQILNDACSDGAGGFVATFADHLTGLPRVSHVGADGLVQGNDSGNVVWQADNIPLDIATTVFVSGTLRRNISMLADQPSRLASAPGDTDGSGST